MLTRPHHHPHEQHPFIPFAFVFSISIVRFVSCVADNALGRTKKYIEISGRPGPAEFISPMFSGSLEYYNLTWSVESIPPLEEIRLLYRRLMVSDQVIIKRSHLFHRHIYVCVCAFLRWCVSRWTRHINILANGKTFYWYQHWYDPMEIITLCRM